MSNGKIELIIGPMFSGKTTEMLSRIQRAALANQSVLVIKFAGDKRYDTGDDTLTTHSGISTRGKSIRVVATDRLDAVEVGLTHVVGVDEGQFYPDLLEKCERWANAGVRVIVSALDGDFRRQPFGQVCALVPLCEDVTKQKGVCMKCRARDAAFTDRTTQSTALVEIGAQEMYRCLCRQCFMWDKPTDASLPQ